MTPPPSAFATNELFRYARVRPPRIIDLRSRARKDPELRALLEQAADDDPPQQAESRQDRVLSGSYTREPSTSAGAPASLGELTFDYRRHLRVEELPADRLPMAADLRDPASFDPAAIRRDPGYRADRKALLLQVASLRLATPGREESAELTQAARMLDFVETFPDLPRRRTREPYATVVLKRPEVRVIAAPARREPVFDPAPPVEAQELHEVAEGLQVLWRARHRMLQERKRAFDRAHRQLMRDIPQLPPVPRPPAILEPPVPEAPAPEVGERSGRVTKGKRVTRASAKSGRKSAEKAAGKAAGKPADAPMPDDRADDAARVEAANEYRRLLKERADVHAAAIRKRTAALVALREEYEQERQSASLERMLSSSAKTVAKYVSGKSESQVGRMMNVVKEYAYGTNVPVSRFCEAYEQAVNRGDTMGANQAKPDFQGSACFAESPDLVFADTVRILGEADLIRVDETFVKYSAGEISYVENVLAGEVRKRKVKATRYLEQLTETISEETTEGTKETGATTKQDLKSQVESEINTRLETDISASANASGGGTIGVVEVQGGGSVDASLGMGLDTSLGTSNESRFSQEIVSKALERTKQTVVERRMSRAYSLDETSNLHAIRNDGENAESFNGVYCFLNRHVAITESVYGRRLFLLANIRVPGKSLLCSRMHRLHLAYEDVGVRPTFDITPADITPANYMALAGRFKAQNVAPPPAPIVRLGRTYKTDTTNTNSEAPEFNGRQIAEVLVPFFAKYKRFLITDNVALPDGYEVMDVTVTVNHGANGISIPADLPLRAGGAMAFAAPALAAYGGYGPFLLPVWLWSVGFLASPLLHYNADSSNVTVGIGTESQDSPYYFFDPDALIKEIFNLFGSISASLPSILSEIEAGIVPLMTKLASNAGKIPGQVASAVTSAVNTFIAAIKQIFTDIINLDPAAALDHMATLGFSITQGQLQNLQNTMGTLFEPFRAFIQNALDLIGGAVGTAIGDLFAYFMQLWESSQTFSFAGAQGTRGELPISLNTIAIKPGITVNLSACLRRTEEALARWQLETFANFYRAHLQLMADYESRALMAGNGAHRVAKPPALLRAEEHTAVKERVLYALNNAQGNPGNSYTFDRMNFFEHALDWPNMTYRVFNYGPTPIENILDKRGAFIGADERRRAFSMALWAQVMIPVADSDHFVEQVMSYFEHGTFSMDGTLEDDELVALYRDFVLGREAEPLEVSAPRFETVPTEFIVIQTPDLATQLPTNPAYVNP